jgi:hypothetical protein
MSDEGNSMWRTADAGLDMPVGTLRYPLLELLLLLLLQAGLEAVSQSSCQQFVASVG